MKNLKNIEVFKLVETEGKLCALISYQNLDNINDPNNGYDWISVPVNIRELQKSSRGNLLVDQSVKEEPFLSANI